MAHSKRSFGWLAVLFALTGVCTIASADTVIVYDASSSMWGQIEGEAKVTIAHRVLSDLVTEWDESEPLGLVAYGHRREGDCSDIETVVPPGPIDREALLARIESIAPRGKTPLSAAVRHAAEALKYRDAPATVILISDGIETCGADPCAVASELSEAGINFTAHVIGFDVGGAEKEQLACIAENTGGRFFAAGDAAGLQAALGEASRIATEEVAEPEVTISAPEAAVAGSVVEVSWQGEKIHPRDLVTIVPAGTEPTVRGAYKRVGDERSTVLQAPGTTGPHEARYVASATGQAVASAPVKLVEAQVTLTVPESTVAGSNFDVAWSGTVHPRDKVTIVPTGSAVGASGDYLRTGNATEGTLQAPSEAGEYEVRYVLEEDGKTLAASPIAVTVATTGVSGPERVVGGSNFTVSWTNGIHPRDKVTIVAAGAPPEADGDYLRVGNAESGTLQAPAAAGDYEVRYLLEEDGLAIASAPVVVTAPETSVSGPATAVAGSRIDVAWTRTIHPRDKVTIVPADAPPDADRDYRRTGNASSGPLDTEAEPGDYEVRYILEVSDRSIASAPIVLTAPEVTITAPGSVAAGSRLEVSWSTTVHPRDKVTIVAADAPADEDGDYKRVGGGGSATLVAPETAGDYEVRYLLNASGRMIASKPVRIE